MGMNSTTVSNKENAQDGVILFKDVCTQEWAMNTVKHAVAR
jgi:hypothetical protein